MSTKSIKRLANGKIQLEGKTWVRASDVFEDYKEFITVDGVNYYPQSKKEKKPKMELETID